MGFVTLGIFIMNMQGMDGAMMVMLAHGFNTGGLFLIVGVIYERAHTRNIAAFGGIASRMPIWAAYFMLFMFASIGLPGLSGFVGEFLVALGTWDYNPWAAAITFSVVIFAAWYMLWLFQRVVFGRASGEAPDPGDTQLTASEEAEIARSGGHHGWSWPAPAQAGQWCRPWPRRPRGHGQLPDSRGPNGQLALAGPDTQGVADALPARRADDHLRCLPEAAAQHR
jgi:hypothetical protein